LLGKHKGKPVCGDERADQACVKTPLKASVKNLLKKMKLLATPQGQFCVAIWIPRISQRRNIMSSTGDKIKGTANEAVGNIKQAIGKATDNDRLRAEGKAQELKGEAQKAKGNVKETIKKGIDRA